MAYKKRYPRVEINLVEAAAEQLKSNLDRSEVQLAILPSGHDPFEGRLLYPIHVCAAVSNAHRLARKKVIEISDLADEPLLLLGRQFGLRWWFEAACDVANIRPTALMESVAPHTLIALAREGFGIAIVPSDTQPRQKALRVIPVTHRRAAVGRWAVVTWNPQRFLPPYAEKFVSELAASIKRDYPGIELLRSAPRLPRPKQPMR